MIIFDFSYRKENKLYKKRNRKESKLESYENGQNKIITATNLGNKLM